MCIFKTLFSKINVNKKDIIKIEDIEDPITPSVLKTVKQGICIELLDEEVICKFDFFAGECRYIKANPPEGMIPFPGKALKSFALFYKPGTENPDEIDHVTVSVGEEETYLIPGWEWDGLLEFNYENYKYKDMLETVSNERAIEADFSLIDKIKEKCFELYKDYIGEEYTKDDIYTSCGKVIRKYTVQVTDNITGAIISFKTFDGEDDAIYYYNQFREGIKE